jgi:hypothetical protein
MKSNLSFYRRQCRAAGASAIGGYPLEPWRDIRDASPHAGGGPAHHHTVGSPGEPLGRWVPLLVARAGWLLAVLDPLRHLATTSDCSGEMGPRWWWWRTRWWKRRRRGGNGSDDFRVDFGDDLGETALLDLGWNAALWRVKYNWWHNRDELPLAIPMERRPGSTATTPRFKSSGSHIFLVFSFFLLLIFILYFICSDLFSVWFFYIIQTNFRR